MWQPIKTAPRNNKVIQLLSTTDEVVAGFWNENGTAFPWTFLDPRGINFLDAYREGYITHWQPLAKKELY